MIVIGFLATKLYKYTPKTTDIYLAMVGGIAFIAGEILSTSTFKEDAKALEKKEGPPDSAQIEALTKLKKSYEAAKKSTSTKKMLQITAAGAFGIAAIMAFFIKSTLVANQVAVNIEGKSALNSMNVATEKLNTSCTTGTNPAACKEIPTVKEIEKTVSKAIGAYNNQQYNAELVLDSQSVIAKGKTEAAHIKWTNDFIDKLLMNAPEAGSMIRRPIKATEDQINKGVNYWKKNSPSAEPTALIANNNHNAPAGTRQTPSARGGGAGVRLPFDATSMMEQRTNTSPTMALNFFEKILDFVLPNAKAGTMSLLWLAGGAAISMLLGKTLGAKIDTYMAASKNRGIIWGVLAGLSYMASSGSTKTLKKIDDNIKKIDDILKGVDKSTSKGNTVGDEKPSNTPKEKAAPRTQTLGNSINATSTPAIITSTTEATPIPIESTAPAGNPEQTVTIPPTEAPITSTPPAQPDPTNTTNSTTPPNLSLTSGTGPNAIGRSAVKNKLTQIPGSSSAATTSTQTATTGFDSANASGAIRFHPTLRTSCLDHDGDTHCKSIRSMAMNSPGFQEFPLSIQKLASEALAIGDDLSETNEVKQSTLLAIQSFGAKQPEIAKLLDLRKANLNKQLIQNRFAPIDFAKEENIFLTSANNEVAKVLRNQNMSPEEYLKLIGRSLFEKDLESNASKNSVGNAYSAPTLDNHSSDGSTQSGPISNPLIEKTPEPVAEAKDEHELDIRTNDITTDSKASLFDIISSRYIKSAYRRLIDDEVVEQK